jgi:hypothetical protein
MFIKFFYECSMYIVDVRSRLGLVWAHNLFSRVLYSTTLLYHYTMYVNTLGCTSVRLTANINF